MTQRDVAAALGTSPATVSRMENGADHIPRERVAQFAEIFGIDPVDFHKRVLSYRDPWSYVGIFGALPDPALQAELDAERVKYDPERPRAKAGAAAPHHEDARPPLRPREGRPPRAMSSPSYAANSRGGTHAGLQAQGRQVPLLALRPGQRGRQARPAEHEAQEQARSRGDRPGCGAPCTRSGIARPEAHHDRRGRRGLRQGPRGGQQGVGA